VIKGTDVGTRHTEDRNLVNRCVDLVAGARPNFMKLAPVERALRASGRVRARVVHTGQHYDKAMNDVFFTELGIPEPEVHLEVGSGSHGMQTGRILERYEAHLLASRPAATVVFGDVNSTIACALAAVKVDVPVVHVEAGLRSFDRTMPEEINRLLVDAISELLLVTEESGVENLRREGVPDTRVRLVGNVMIDTLVANLRSLDGSFSARMGLEPSSYGLVTLHRPSNVDEPETLERLLLLLGELAGSLPLVFPVHPRTRKVVEQAGLERLLERAPGLRCLPPVSYGENLALMQGAKVVLTDSGGMQEETTYLRVPCLTLRENTERPVTTTIGTSLLVGNDSERIRAAFARVLGGDWPTGSDVPLWDGHAADRVADEIVTWLDGRSK
jgi:UDP-N-acetylglucosamine 2-epimerase (non-hydrolysing)